MSNRVNPDIYVLDDDNTPTPALDKNKNEDDEAKLPSVPSEQFSIMEQGYEQRVYRNSDMRE